MAFVFKSDRNLNFSNARNPNVGPGSYIAHKPLNEHHKIK